MPHSPARWLCITVSNLQGLEGGEMCAWSEVGTRPCYSARGLWTQKKQWDLSSVNLRLWSRLMAPAWPRRRWSGNRAVQGDPSARPTSCIRQPPALGLRGSGTISPTNSLPLLQTHPFSGTHEGKSGPPEMLALLAWRCSQDSCLEKGRDGYSAENPMIDYYLPCLWEKVGVGWIVSPEKIPFFNKTNFIEV